MILLTSYLTVPPQLKTPLMKLSKDTSHAKGLPMTSMMMVMDLPLLVTATSFMVELTLKQLNKTTLHQFQIVDTGSTVNANSSLLRDMYQVFHFNTLHGSSHTMDREYSTNTLQSYKLTKLSTHTTIFTCRKARKSAGNLPMVICTNA